MFNLAKRDSVRYPHQFWLLFWGALINRASVSMMWPFLTVYLRQQLDVSLTTITLLLTLRAVTSVFSTAVTSSFMDRIGRKWVMVISVYLSAAVYVGMVFADSLAAWALLLAAHGTVLPIFNNGVNTMVADIIPSERRAPAYALMRTISNIGIAIGPVIGGFVVAVVSFQLVFTLIAVSLLILASLGLWMLSETKPQQLTQPDANEGGGYVAVIRDQRFMIFLAGYFMTLMGATQVFALLPIYTVENFGLTETEYSLFLTVNAIMVVTLQYFVTRFTDNYPTQRVIIVGSFVYMLGIISIIPGSTLLHFILSMVIFTIGELIFEPTALKFVADIAPDDMRARYMGLISLGYPVGAGLGPVIGGVLNDTIAPVAIWYGAALLAFGGVIIFWLSLRQQRKLKPSIA